MVEEKLQSCPLFQSDNHFAAGELWLVESAELTPELRHRFSCRIHCAWNLQRDLALPLGFFVFG